MYIYIYIYKVSQEECARIREGVPYVKVYRYNPKHLCPKLNGYGDNGHRKVCLFWRVHALYLSADKSYRCLSLSLVSDSAHTTRTVMQQAYTRMRSQPCYVSAYHPCVMYSSWNTKDDHDMRASFFVVQFNGFLSLTSQFDVKYRY